MAVSSGESWRRPVSSVGLELLAVILGVLAIWFTLQNAPPSLGWRFLPVVSGAGAGWILGWLGRERRMGLEAKYGLRPRRSDEPPPPDDGPVVGAPVA